MSWLGFDPGGDNAFGMAVLRNDGKSETDIGSCVDHAVEFYSKHRDVDAVGIDAPLWWATGPGGGRAVDRQLRRTYGLGGTVQTANSLQGSVVIQGVLLASRFRELDSNIKITEAHPTALRIVASEAKPRGFNSFDPAEIKVLISNFIDQYGPEREHSHRLDALLAAFSAREGYSGRWVWDLARLEREKAERHPMWFGDVNYWWPEEVSLATE